MVRAVVFDMDGVVVDSEWLHQTTEVVALGEVGVEMTADDLVQYTGMPLVPLLERVRSDRSADFDAEAVAARKRSLYLDRLHELEPIDGAVAAVRRLGADYRIGLATSSARPVVDEVLELLDLEDAFDATFSTDDVENGKPDPEVFEATADALGASPGATVVVEDSRTGVEAALAGGFRAVGFQSDPEIDLSAAEHVGTSMEEVERYVERIDGPT